MKSKYIGNFFVGFLVATILTAWLYWLWRQKREIMPEPLALSQNQAATLPDAERKSAAPTPDRLEAIRGIGPVYARRLNLAGIYTYSQLAALSPEQLQSIVESTRWDPSEWIDAAKRLAAAG